MRILRKGNKVQGDRVLRRGYAPFSHSNSPALAILSDRLVMRLPQTQ